MQFQTILDQLFLSQGLDYHEFLLLSLMFDPSLSTLRIITHHGTFS